MSSSFQRLGRHLAYRIVLHEACRSGSPEEQGALLAKLETRLRIDAAARQALLGRELAASKGKPPRPFDPEKAYRAAVRIALLDRRMSSRELKILNRLGACLGIERTRQKQIVRSLVADAAAGHLPSPATISAEHVPVQEEKYASGDVRLESGEVVLGDEHDDELVEADDEDGQAGEGAIELGDFEQPAGAHQRDPRPAPPPEPGTTMAEPRGVTTSARTSKATEVGTVHPAAERPRPPEGPRLARTTGSTKVVGQMPLQAETAASKRPDGYGTAQTKPVRTQPGESGFPIKPFLVGALAALIVASVTGLVVFVVSRPDAPIERPKVSTRRGSGRPRPIDGARQPKPARDGAGSGSAGPETHRPPPAPPRVHRAGPPPPAGDLYRRAEQTGRETRRAEAATLVTSSYALAARDTYRRAALVRLVGLGLEAGPARHALSRIARTADDSLRLEAALALGRLRDANSSELLETLSRSSRPVERGVGLLGRARLDGDRRRWETEVAQPEACWRMGRFLAEAGDPEAVGLLVRCLRTEDSERKTEALGLLAGGPGGAAGSVGDFSAVDAVLDALGDANGSVRIAALDCLGQIGDRSALPAAMRSLSDPRTGERRAALRVLSVLGDNEAAERMLEALGDPDAAVREEAAVGLAALDNLPVQFLAGRLRRLERGSELRLSLASALLRPEHPEVLAATWPLLPQLDRAERKLALDLLAGLGEFATARPAVRSGLEAAKRRAEPDLAEVLREASGRLDTADARRADRASAVEKELATGNAEAGIRSLRLLSAIFGHAKFEPLARQALHPDAIVRRHCYAAVGRTATEEDLPFLRNLCARVSPPEQPLFSEHLARLGDPMLVDLFADQLERSAGDGVESRALRRLAAWGLARMGVPEAAAPLTRALSDTSWPVRMLAAWGLNRMVTLGILGGAEADRARLRLIELLRDPRLEVQWAARGR